MYEGRRVKGFRVPDNLNGVKFSREQYGDEWKRKDVRPTNLVDFEHVAKHHNINIMLYELKAKDGRSSKRGMRYVKDGDVKAISRFSCMVTIW